LCLKGLATQKSAQATLKLLILNYLLMLMRMNSMKLLLKILLSLVLPAQLVSFASTSVALINTDGSVSLPNAAPFNALGSYWIDYRVTGWSFPASGCGRVVQMPSGGGGTLQVFLCPAANGWPPFILFPGNDSTPGGTGILMSPPHISVAAVSGTNPMVLTLGSTPFPVTMAVNSTITVSGATGPGCAGMNANQKIIAVSGNNVTIAYNGSGCVYIPNSANAYSQDFVMRFRRDLTANLATGESWNMDGTGYAEVVEPIVAPASSGASNYITFGAANLNLAYFRWYSGTIPVGSKPPWGNSANAGSSVLGDWEFEGSGADNGPNHLTISFSHFPTFMLTPRYAPACVMGAQQSWRVGSAAQLDGSHSFPLDDGASLQYFWGQSISSEPGTPLQLLNWSSHTSPTPTITGFLAGPLNFTLTVRDQSGTSTACQVHNGAVATDSLGRVQISDPKISSLLGPLTHWGVNTRWPWFDQVEKQWADLMSSLQGTVQPGRLVSNFVDHWNVPQQGNVSATYGSVRITGFNTSFKSTFCQGGTYSTNVIVLWYPQPGFIGGTGRRGLPVGKCVSDTILDLGWQYSDDNGSNPKSYQVDAPPGFAYTQSASLLWRPGIGCSGGPTTINVNGMGPVPLKEADGVTDPSPSDCPHNSNPNLAVSLTYNGKAFTIQGTFTPPIYYYWVWITLPGTTSGMNYSLWTQDDLGSWVGQSTNINYYDNVLAFYTMYYRTGIDTYLHAARWLADKWWTMPLHDQGNAMSGLVGTALMPRIQAETGLFLRAIDQDDVNGVPGSSPMWPGLRSEVDNGYRYVMNTQMALNVLTGDLRETAYNDMYVALCAAYDPNAAHAAQCRSDLNNSIQNTWKSQRQPDGSWQAFSGEYASIPTEFPIISSGTSGTVSVTPGSNIVTIQGSTWSPSWFPAEFLSIGNPMNYGTRDAKYYNATYIDSTHIQLDRPYSDPCGNLCSGRQWVMSTGTPGTQWIAFGVQPFMLGITGQFFNQAHIALGMDPQYSTSAALVKSYVGDAANWLSTTGTETVSRGLWYGVGFGICAQPNLSRSCYSNSDPNDYVGARELSPEVLGAMAMGYSYAPSSALQAAVDNLFSAVYAKNPSDPGYDGTYAQDMDPLNRGFFWQTLNPKWFGFFWGMGRNAAWLSTR
jgi:hypothetical protein